MSQTTVIFLLFTSPVKKNKKNKIQNTVLQLFRIVNKMLTFGFETKSSV